MTPTRTPSVTPPGTPPVTPTATPAGTEVSGFNGFFGGIISDISVNGVTILGVTFPVSIGDGFSGTTPYTGVADVDIQVANVSPNGNVVVAVAGGSECVDVAGGANISRTLNITGGVYISCNDGACS